MGLDGEHADPLVADRVSEVLKWILLAGGILTFGLLGWATVETYRTAPPQPERLLAASGAVVMTGHDIAAGKAFRKPT